MLEENEKKTIFTPTQILNSWLYNSKKVCVPVKHPVLKKQTCTHTRK